MLTPQNMGGMWVPITTEASVGLIDVLVKARMNAAPSAALSIWEARTNVLPLGGLAHVKGYTVCTCR